MGETLLSISNFEGRDARRLFLKILAFVPIILFVGVVNFYIDPLGLYRKEADPYQRDEYKIAQALVQGKNVELFQGDKDDRLVQKYFVENMTTVPDVVILGSSHSMWLGDNIFVNEKVVNHSVLGAILADYLGIFEGYAKKNVFPKRVICVLDPQLTIFPVTSQRWISIKEDVNSMLGRLGIHSEKINAPAVSQAWLNIFSFSYFQEAMDELYQGNHVQGYRVTQAINGKYLMFKDGRCWPGFFFKHPEKNRRRMIRELNQGLYGPQMKPDKELGDILEKFIRYLTAQHIRVTLCLLPIHPQMYKSFLKPQKRQGGLDIASLEQNYRDLAKKLNLEIVGSYDPAACNLDGKDFYDGEHIKNDVIEKIFKQKASPCFMPGI